MIKLLLGFKIILLNLELFKKHWIIQSLIKNQQVTWISLSHILLKVI